MQTNEMTDWASVIVDSLEDHTIDQVLPTALETLDNHALTRVLLAAAADLHLDAADLQMTGRHGVIEHSLRLTFRPNRPDDRND